MPEGKSFIDTQQRSLLFASGSSTKALCFIAIMYHSKSQLSCVNNCNKEAAAKIIKFDFHYEKKSFSVHAIEKLEIYVTFLIDYLVLWDFETC